LKVARKGWNGKNMFAYIVGGEEVNGELLNSSARKHVYPLLTGPTDETRIELRPYFELKTAQNDIAKWAPSGSDALAEDWEIAE
jgi:hypothetical protein